MPSYVVTGANRGLGLEFVKQLSAPTDNTVFAIVRNKANAKDLSSLQSTRKNLHILEGDLTNPQSFKDAAAAVSKVTGGTLDVLVNNASNVPAGPGLRLDGYPEGQEAQIEHDFVDTFKVNVVGTIHVINAFLPLIRATSKTGTAKVITISSGVADADFTLKAGWHLSGAYSVSKAAQNAMVVKYAATFKDDNIIFLSISPGLVDTSVEPPSPELLEEVLKMFALFKAALPNWDGKPITPEESVNKMLDVIAKVTKKDSGSFLSHHGNKEWL